MITIPTLSELRTQILTALEAEYGDTVPTFGKVFLRAFANVQAAKMKLYYLAIAKLQKNIFADTADRESLGGTLERFGRIKLGRNPFPAQAGEYSVAVTGTIGSVIKANATFKSNDDSLNPGYMFILDSEFELTTSPDTITLRALTAGTDSRLQAGDELTATAPISGVNSLVTILEETTEPQAAEDIEEYRTKVLDAYKLEPQGGSGSDYRIWSADAQGVLRVYPYAKDGASNEINLFVEATIEDSTDNKGTPTAGILQEVEEVVEFDPDETLPITERGRRPLGVFQVHYLPITPLDVDIEIADFVGLTEDIETIISDALEERITLIRPFVSSCDVLEDKDDILDTNLIIATILSARPGSVFGTVTLTVDGSPVSTYTFEDGDIPYFNSVTIS